LRAYDEEIDRARLRFALGYQPPENFKKKPDETLHWQQRKLQQGSSR
jgi:hypothetical protein